jgi:hypothetical protein
MMQYQCLGARGYWKSTIQKCGTRPIPTLRKENTQKHSFPQYSTEGPKPSGQIMSSHNFWQTTAASAPTSIKGQRRPHHYVAAPKRKNKQLFTSWKNAAYAPKLDLRRSNTHAPPNNAASHKHRRSVQPNQQHLPHVTGTIDKWPAVTTPQSQDTS